MSHNALEHRKLLLQRDDLCRIGITKSNTTLLRWEALGRFPCRIRMAGTSVAWLASDVERWLKDRADERSRVSGVPTTPSSQRAERPV